MWDINFQRPEYDHCLKFNISEVSSLSIFKVISNFLKISQVLGLLKNVQIFLTPLAATEYYTLNITLNVKRIVTFIILNMGCIAEMSNVIQVAIYIDFLLTLTLRSELLTFF